MPCRMVMFFPLLIFALSGGAAQPLAALPQGTARSVHLTQVGFETAGAKRAIVVDASAHPLAFVVTDMAGAAVIEGRTQPFGASGGVDRQVHRIDLTRIDRPGTYRLKIAGHAERRFAVADRPV